MTEPTRSDQHVSKPRDIHQALIGAGCLATIVLWIAVVGYGLGFGPADNPTTLLNALLVGASISTLGLITYWRSYLVHAGNARDHEMLLTQVGEVAAGLGQVAAAIEQISAKLGTERDAYWAGYGSAAQDLGHGSVTQLRDRRN
jgi:hypothetical protein